MTTPELDITSVSRIVVPSGRDYGRCLEAFEDTYSLTSPQFLGRRLLAQAGGVEYARVKGKDVPALVAGGYADVGLTGTDVCEEQIATPEHYNLRYRAIGRPMCSFSVLLPGKNADILRNRLNSQDAEPVVIATSYPGFLNRCIERVRQAGMPINVAISSFRPAGSAEVIPALGISEAVADLVESGDTALENGLVIGPKLADVSPAIIWRSTP